MVARTPRNFTHLLARPQTLPTPSLSSSTVHLSDEPRPFLAHIFPALKRSAGHLGRRAEALCIRMSSVSGCPSESELTYVPLIVFYFCEFSSIALHPPVRGRLFVRTRTHLSCHSASLISPSVHPLCLKPPHLHHLSSPRDLNSALSLLPLPSFMLTLLSFSSSGPRVPPLLFFLASFHGRHFT